jgi:hypothetical protein
MVKSMEQLQPTDSAPNELLQYQMYQQDHQKQLDK